MKLKFLSLIIASTVAVAISFTSCSGNTSSSNSNSSTSASDEDVFNAEPTGDPEKDAEVYAKAVERESEINLESMEVYAQMLEYYAEKGDYEAFQKFVNEYEKLEREINLKHLKEVEEIQARLSKARAKITGENIETEEAPDSVAVESTEPVEINPEMQAEDPNTAVPIEQPNDDKEP